MHVYKCMPTYAWFFTCNAAISMSKNVPFASYTFFKAVYVWMRTLRLHIHLNTEIQHAGFNYVCDFFCETM